MYEPYIEQARYAAEYRNWWWTSVRETNDVPEQRQVHPPDTEVSAYPAPKTKIADRPEKDGGKNFGRIARLSGLMDEYTASMRRLHVGGIPAEHWISFFKLHAEAKDPDIILHQLTKELMQRGLNEEATADIVASIMRIAGQLR